MATNEVLFITEGRDQLAFEFSALANTVKICLASRLRKLFTITTIRGRDEYPQVGISNANERNQCNRIAGAMKNVGKKGVISTEQATSIETRKRQ